MSIDPKQKPKKRKLSLAQKIAFNAASYASHATSAHIIPYHARMGVRALTEKKS